MVHFTKRLIRTSIFFSSFGLLGLYRTVLLANRIFFGEMSFICRTDIARFGAVRKKILRVPTGTVRFLVTWLSQYSVNSS
jgi:hypothetical protein